MYVVCNFSGVEGSGSVTYQHFGLF
jgi:hypothetical protein